MDKGKKKDPDLEREILQDKALLKKQHLIDDYVTKTLESKEEKRRKNTSPIPTSTSSSTMRGKVTTKQYDRDRSRVGDKQNLSDLGSTESEIRKNLRVKFEIGSIAPEKFFKRDPLVEPGETKKPLAIMPDSNTFALQPYTYYQEEPQTRVITDLVQSRLFISNLISSINANFADWDSIRITNNANTNQLVSMQENTLALQNQVTEVREASMQVAFWTEEAFQYANA